MHLFLIIYLLHNSYDLKCYTLLAVRQAHPSTDFVNPSQGFVMPGPFYLNEPSLTSLQLRQANVAELKNNDEYWQNRLKALEANHKKINEIMEQETQRAVSQL